MSKFLDIEYKENLKLDVYCSLSHKATLIFFHGGGFEAGDKLDIFYSGLSNDLIEKGFDIVSVNYSLYPNTKFPLFIYDGAEAIKYILSHIKDFNISSEIYVVGQSAGAWLITMLCVNPIYLKSVNVDSKLIKGWISDSGQMTSHFNMIKFEDNLNPLVQRIDEKAPLFFVNEKLNFTRLLLIYYSNDMPNRKLQNLLMESAIKNINPQLDVESVEFEGTHCNGTCNRNKKGSFDFVDYLLTWM